MVLPPHCSRPACMHGAEQMGTLHEQNLLCNLAPNNHFLNLQYFPKQMGPAAAQRTRMQYSNSWSVYKMASIFWITNAESPDAGLPEHLRFGESCGSWMMKTNRKI